MQRDNIYLAGEATGGYMTAPVIPKSGRITQDNSRLMLSATKCMNPTLSNMTRHRVSGLDWPQMVH